MFTRGLTRGFAIDRKRILIQRTPLVISQPTAAQKVNEKIKAELIAKILERKSVGGGGGSTGGGGGRGGSAGTQKTITGTQRSSSSSSTTTKTQTTKKTTSSPTVTDFIVFVQKWIAVYNYVFQPPLSTSSGGCSLNKY